MWMPGCLVEPRRAVVERFRAFGEVAEHVELGDRRGRALERLEIRGDPRHELLVERLLACERAFAGAEHPVLELLELGGDVALRALQGLAPDVVGRRPLALGLGELDVVAVHAVVPDAEVRGAGAFALARLERFEEGVRVGGQAAQLVELGVVAGGEHPAVAHEHRRGIDHRAVEQRRHFRKLAVLADELPDARTVGAGDRLAQSRHRVQRGAKLREVSRPSGRETDAGQDALEVSDVREQSRARFRRRRARRGRRPRAGVARALRGRARDASASGAAAGFPSESPPDP